MSYRMKMLFIVALIMIYMVLAAFTNTAKENEHADKHPEEVQEMQLGDIREETGGPQHLPEFLGEKPEDMKIIYQAAALNKDLLEKVPCYCGCGESVGHKDNYDCFIH